MNIKSKIGFYYKSLFPFAILVSSFYKTDIHAFRLEAFLFIWHELFFWIIKSYEETSISAIILSTLKTRSLQITLTLVSDFGIAL